MENKKQNISCKDCAYYDDNIGTGMCYRAHGLKQILALLLIGPRPLINMGACKYIKYVNQKQK